MKEYNKKLTHDTVRSTRATGDALENILSENFGSLIGDLCKEYSADFARRAMADIAFSDIDGLYYVVDVKSHRIDAKFSMPNLTSVERLSRFYEDDNNYFLVLMISYNLKETKVIASEVTFVPIEFLSWDCLTVGALGWGQIQIANSNNILINHQYSRKKWMLEFCDIMFEFYPREISKISNRIRRFEEIKEFWLQKPDD